MVPLIIAPDIIPMHKDAPDGCKYVQLNL